MSLLVYFKKFSFICIYYSNWHKEFSWETYACILKFEKKNKKKQNKMATYFVPKVAVIPRFDFNWV